MRRLLAVEVRAIKNTSKENTDARIWIKRIKRRYPRL